MDLSNSFEIMDHFNECLGAIILGHNVFISVNCKSLIRVCHIYLFVHEFAKVVGVDGDAV